MSSNDNLTPVEGSIVFVLLLTLCSGFMGLLQVVDSGDRGCRYESLADFAPPRAAVCELFRKRFNQPEPVLDVPRRHFGDPLAPGVLP